MKGLKFAELFFISDLKKNQLERKNSLLFKFPATLALLSTQTKQIDTL